MTGGLITGLFTLGGVLLSGLLALLGYWLKTNHDLRRELLSRHFERRLELYVKVCEFAAAMYQSGSKQYGMGETRDMYRDLLILGAPGVIRAFNSIFDTSADKLQAKGMNEETIASMQTQVYRDLFNAMRADLFPCPEKLKETDIRMLEPKKTSWTVNSSK